MRDDGSPQRELAPGVEGNHARRMGSVDGVAVVALSLGPADAKCSRRAKGECGYRVRVVHRVHVTRSADGAGTEVRTMASSQIAMAKKQLDMVDAAVSRAKQQQDMATEAIARAKQEQEKRRAGNGAGQTRERADESAG
jgi:hypothetical protein